MPLKKEGITPDFQFALEIHQDSIIKEVYSLDPELPLVLLYFADEIIKRAANKVFMVGAVGRHNIVELACPVPFVHPSTGSFAVAVALMCNPSHLYLIGLDLGFRDQSHTHVKDSRYNIDSVKELEEQYQKRSDTSPVAANFSGNEPVFSKPFYNQARMSIESAIDYWINQKKIDCKVYNFSDGAKIKGAEGERSATHRIGINKNSSQDRKEIISSFQAAVEGYNWSSFTLHGKEQLEEFKNILLDKLTLEKFTLIEFSKAVDNAPLLSIQENNKNDPGKRIECYFRVIIDLMQDWYRFILFCNTVEESERIYKEGLALIKKSIYQLEWPGE